MTSPGNSGIGELTELDEWPRHQLPRPFDVVGSDSPHWSDGYYFTVSDGTVSLFTAIRLYPNNDVLDGYACAGVDGTQHNLRWSRRLRPSIDDLSVGPLSVAIERPLRVVRTRCGSNEFGIAYDLTWTGLHEPYLEKFVERYSAGRLTAQRCNYGQCCAVDGWIEVAGRRFDVHGWAGARDHSWGIGRTGGPRAPSAAPQPEPRTFAERQWAMLRFADRSVFWQLHTNDDGEFTMFESRVFGRDGEAWSYTRARELTLSLVPGHRRMREGTLVLERPDGGLDRFRFVPTGTPVYLQGGGYWQGFDDGLGRGVYRGDDHGEGEVWDVSLPDEVHDPKGLFRARPDAWAESFGAVENIDDPADRGFGHLECVIAGDHPDLH